MDRGPTTTGACPECGHAFLYRWPRLAEAAPLFLLLALPALSALAAWLANGSLVGAGLGMAGGAVPFALTRTPWGARRYWGGLGCSACNWFSMYR